MSSPCEGTGFEIGSMSIIKGAPNLDNAKKWYDWALTPEAQKLGAQANSFQIPSNKNAPIPEQAPKMAEHQADRLRLRQIRLVRRAQAPARTLGHGNRREVSMTATTDSRVLRRWADLSKQSRHVVAVALAGAGRALVSALVRRRDRLLVLRLARQPDIGAADAPALLQATRCMAAGGCGRILACLLLPLGEALRPNGPASPGHRLGGALGLAWMFGSGFPHRPQGLELTA